MKGKIIALTALSLTLPTMLLAWGGNQGMCGYGPGIGPGWNGGFHAGGFIMMIIILIILGLLAFMAFKHIKNNKTEIVTGNNSLNILKTRYAKGEITKEEYHSIKKDLND